MSEWISSVHYFNELLDQYSDKFKQNFPTMLTKHLSVEEQISLIEKCIENNAPYNAEYSDSQNKVY